MSAYRDVILAVSGWKPLERFARRRGLRLGANRFVAGEDLEAGVKAAHAIAAEGKYPILDLLGEFVDDPETAGVMAAGVRATIDALAEVPGPRMLSIKPTQVGLGLGFDVALAHLRPLAERAGEVGVRLALDMEDHPRVDDTLRLLESLHDEGHTHVSTVLQSYLYRTEADLARLTARSVVPELRLVKGAYREPSSVAYPDKADVDGAYRSLLDTMLDAGGIVHVASHDEKLIRYAQRERDARGVPRDRVTFQLLYGVKPRLQAQLLAEGESVGVYTPFGEDWYGYFTRRLAERPANLSFVLRGLFG